MRKKAGTALKSDNSYNEKKEMGKEKNIIRVEQSEKKETSLVKCSLLEIQAKNTKKEL